MSDWHFRFFVVGCVTVLVVYSLIDINTSRLDLNGNMTGTQNPAASLGSCVVVVLGGNALEWGLRRERRQRMIVQYLIPLSAGSVPGLKSQLILWTSQGFVSLFLYVVGFSDRAEL